MSNELQQVYQRKLDALLPLITPQDKKDLLEHRVVSRPVLEAYLKGEVNKISTANKIIGFFEDRINQRISNYQKTNAA